MHILLTNDDGILAPGILALHNCLEGLGERHVVAPANHQSATGHGITIYDPLRVRPMTVANAFTGHAVEGRPADCVKLALTHVLAQKPDLVVSGINDGSNVGLNVIYSGTVAAAAEAALFNIPAVAVSLSYSTHTDFERAARHTRRVLDWLLRRPLPRGVVINVNLPDQALGEPLEPIICRQSTVAIADVIERRVDPAGRPYFWAVGGHHEGDGHDEESDVAALRRGHITICPLHFDLTAYDVLNELKGQ